MACYVSYIFFFKQKTAYEMRISDWSSDVCSSDLRDLPDRAGAPGRRECGWPGGGRIGPLADGGSAEDDDSRPRQFHRLTATKFSVRMMCRPTPAVCGPGSALIATILAQQVFKLLLRGAIHRRCSSKRPRSAQQAKLEITKADRKRVV